MNPTHRTHRAGHRSLRDAPGRCTGSALARLHHVRRRGSVGLYTDGTIVSPPVGVFTAVGRVTFTESGTFSGAQTTSIAGNFFEETVQGTSTVNSDCTSSAVADVYQGGALVRATGTCSWCGRPAVRDVQAIFLRTGSCDHPSLVTGSLATTTIDAQGAAAAA